MIEIKELKKSFGKNEVLKGINIEVDKGRNSRYFRTIWFW